MLEGQAEKQLNISITKIFNWPSSQAEKNKFELIFLPQQMDSQPILRKEAQGVFMSNSMNLNALLKVSYTQEEKIVLFNDYRQVILNLETEGELLGQFQIDLEALKQKQVQYFPFGTDHVLQMNVFSTNKLQKLQNLSKPVQEEQGSKTIMQREPERRTIRNLEPQVRMNYYDMDEQRSREIKQIEIYQVAAPAYSRQKLLNKQSTDEEYSNNSRLSYYDYEEEGRRRNKNQNPGYQRYSSHTRNQVCLNRYFEYDRAELNRGMKKSFSQKVLTLLQEVQSMKGQISNSQVAGHPRDRHYLENNVFQPSDSQVDFGKCKKSMSENNLLWMKKEPSNVNRKGAGQHRLILDSLNVVPSDEYYQKGMEKSGHNYYGKMRQ